MENRFFTVVARINQILRLLVFSAALVGILLIAGSELFRPNFRSAEVPVAVKPTEASQKVVDVRVLGKMAGMYVIGVLKTEVDGAKKSGDAVFSSGRYDESGELVNVVFSGAQGKVGSLLPQDALVLSHTLPGSSPGYAVRSERVALFRCVTRDSDGNGRLNSSDRSELHLISATDINVRVIILDVIDHQVVSDDEVIAKISKNGVLSLVSIDTRTLTQRPVTF